MNLRDGKHPNLPSIVSVGKGGLLLTLYEVVPTPNQNKNQKLYYYLD